LPPFLSHAPLRRTLSSSPGSCSRRRGTTLTSDRLLSGAPGLTDKTCAFPLSAPAPDELGAASAGAWKWPDGKPGMLGQYTLPTGCPVGTNHEPPPPSHRHATQL